MRRRAKPSGDRGRGYETGWTPREASPPAVQAAARGLPIAEYEGDGWYSYEIEDGIELLYPGLRK